MLSTIFEGIFTTQTITLGQFILCVIVSLALGLLLSAAHSYKTYSSTGFKVTLALLPAIVAVVILMVNGNIGAGVAVAGTFSLVRFRSMPGTAREIGSIFLAMGTGLITGMGYLGFAALFVLILGIAMVLISILVEELSHGKQIDKTLRITIPEDLNYSKLFDDLFQTYTKTHQIVSVKTTNMGSMYKLTYNIILTDEEQEKEFIDAIRCRNGNLEVSLSRKEGNQNEL